MVKDYLINFLYSTSYWIPFIYFSLKGAPNEGALLGLSIWIFSWAIPYNLEH